MSIEGSVVQYISASGNAVITLPKKGLTIVGLSISNNSLTIPITPGRNAVFMGSPVGTYVFVPVQFQTESGEINVSTTGQMVVIVYYGSPLPNTPPLTAYSGILLSDVSISIPASITSSTLYSVNANANFPSSANVITGFEYSAQALPSGVGSLGLGYVSFLVSTGQALNLPVPIGNGNFTPDYPTSTGILPLKIPVVQIVAITFNGYFTNSNTSAVSYSSDLVFYYA